MMGTLAVWVPLCVRMPSCVPQVGGCSHSAQGIPVLRVSQCSGYPHAQGIPVRPLLSDCGVWALRGPADRQQLVPILQIVMTKWHLPAREKICTALKHSCSSDGAGVARDQLLSLLQFLFAFEILISNCFLLIPLNRLMLAIIILYCWYWPLMFSNWAELNKSMPTTF